MTGRKLNYKTLACMMLQSKVNLVESVNGNEMKIRSCSLDEALSGYLPDALFQWITDNEASRLEVFGAHCDQLEKSFERLVLEIKKLSRGLKGDRAVIEEGEAVLGILINGISQFECSARKGVRPEVAMEHAALENLIARGEYGEPDVNQMDASQVESLFVYQMCKNIKAVLSSMLKSLGEIRQNMDRNQAR